MEISSGIIFYRHSLNGVEFFVCTPDGPYWKNRELWNFPKGHAEKDETPFQTACREFQEETSLNINQDEANYKYYGLIQQNSHKSVHVFVKEWKNDWDENFNYDSNVCFSFVNGKKIEHKEIKAYKWMTCEELETKGMQCYLPIFKDLSK